MSWNTPLLVALPVVKTAMLCTLFGTGPAYDLFADDDDVFIFTLTI